VAGRQLDGLARQVKSQPPTHRLDANPSSRLVLLKACAGPQGC
jgi:hypothetical protein